MLGYQLHEGLYCPVILCDACGDPIFKDGNAYWTLPIGETRSASVWHTHKMDCAVLDRRIKRETGQLVLWEQISQHLKQLENNTLIDPQVTIGVGG